MQPETPKHPRRPKGGAHTKKPAAAADGGSKSRARSRPAKRATPAPVAVPAGTVASGAESGSIPLARDDTLAQIRHRLISDAAYTLYVQRGCVDGYDVDDWLEAEARVDRALDASAPAMPVPSIET